MNELRSIYLQVWLKHQRISWKKLKSDKRIYLLAFSVVTGSASGDEICELKEKLGIDLSQPSYDLVQEVLADLLKDFASPREFRGIYLFLLIVNNDISLKELKNREPQCYEFVMELLTESDVSAIRIPDFNRIGIKLDEVASFSKDDLVAAFKKFQTRIHGASYLFQIESKKAVIYPPGILFTLELPYMFQWPYMFQSVMIAPPGILVASELTGDPYMFQPGFQDFNRHIAKMAILTLQEESPKIAAGKIVRLGQMIKAAWPAASFWEIFRFVAGTCKPIEPWTALWYQAKLLRLIQLEELQYSIPEIPILGYVELINNGLWEYHLTCLELRLDMHLKPTMARSIEEAERIPRLRHFRDLLQLMQSLEQTCP